VHILVPKKDNDTTMRLHMQCIQIAEHLKRLKEQFKNLLIFYSKPRVFAISSVNSEAVTD